MSRRGELKRVKFDLWASKSQTPPLSASMPSGPFSTMERKTGNGLPVFKNQAYANLVCLSADLILFQAIAHGFLW